MHYTVKITGHEHAIKELVNGLGQERLDYLAGVIRSLWPGKQKPAVLRFAYIALEMNGVRGRALVHAFIRYAFKEKDHAS